MVVESKGHWRRSYYCSALQWPWSGASPWIPLGPRALISQWRRAAIKMQFSYFPKPGPARKVSLDQRNFCVFVSCGHFSVFLLVECRIVLTLSKHQGFSLHPSPPCTWYFKDLKGYGCVHYRFQKNPAELKAKNMSVVAKHLWDL